MINFFLYHKYRPKAYIYVTNMRQKHLKTILTYDKILHFVASMQQIALDFVVFNQNQV